jgi:hypothetical protein
MWNNDGGLVVHASNGERLGLLTKIDQIQRLLESDPGADVRILARSRGSIWVRDDDARLTFRSFFRVADYHSDTYIAGARWTRVRRGYFEPERPSRTPRGAATLANDERNASEVRRSKIRRIQAANRNRRRQRLEATRKAYLTSEPAR